MPRRADPQHRAGLHARARGSAGSQEEPRNMGAWDSWRAQARVPGRRLAPRYSGRPDSGQPGRGSPTAHAEQRRIVTLIMGPSGERCEPAVEVARPGPGESVTEATMVPGCSARDGPVVERRAWSSLRRQVEHGRRARARACWAKMCPPLARDGLPGDVLAHGQRRQRPAKRERAAPRRASSSAETVTAPNRARSPRRTRHLPAQAQADRPHASPVATHGRRYGVDLGQVTGSGTAGRVRREGRPAVQWLTTGERHRRSRRSGARHQRPLRPRAECPDPRGEEGSDCRGAQTICV